jgi:dTDP-4-dehydrorhamnose reductase
MKRVIVLGANGMLGRTLLLRAIQTGAFVVAATSRPGGFDERLLSLVNTKKLSTYSLDAIRPDESESIFTSFKPDYIINCIGVIKQREEASAPLHCISVNSLFPHWLVGIASEVNAKLIHISTDCVFSGEKGGYLEDDVSDAKDLYGRTKALGEITDKNCITLRTSIIGHEVGKRYGLLDWFLSAQGEVKGFKEAFFTGVTTLELSDQIINLMLSSEFVSGLFHVAGQKISKYELLEKIKTTFRKEVKLVPTESEKIDRSLCGDLWTQVSGYEAPSWDKALEDYRHWSTGQLRYFK